jgi:transglutaminase-like putative cysteine protease
MPKSLRVVTWAAALICLATGPASGVAEGVKRDAKQDPDGRAFLFTYGAVVKGLAPGQAARVWLPVPPSNGDQHVETVGHQLPAKATTATEPKFGNRVLYLETAAGKDGTIPLSLTYRVKRRELRRDPGHAPREERDQRDKREQPAAGDNAAARAAAEQAQAEKAQEALFLRPDSKVPVGPRVKPMKLLEGKALPQDPLARARVFYDVVNAHMVYSKNGTGWGQGDAEWACDSRFGNCSDFHSLFISLARSHGMPAKFEMGFPVPEKHGKGKVGGYHCWAFFKPGGAVRGWVPVDISEANKVPSLSEYYFGSLTPNRVAFTVGRDITLVPKQEGPPLNFFIYPYVEVGGKPLPPEQVEGKFAYEDVGQDEGR